MTLNGFVKVNNKIRKDENFPLQVFDCINLEKSGKNYMLEIKNRKFILKEVSSKEAETKIVKITGKKMLGKGKIQMNLDDGQNFLVKEKFSVGDSVILNTKENKIEKELTYQGEIKVSVIRETRAIEYAR